MLVHDLPLGLTEVTQPQIDNLSNFQFRESNLNDHSASTIAMVIFEALNILQTC